MFTLNFDYATSTKKPSSQLNTLADFDKFEHFIYDFVPLTLSAERIHEFKEPQEIDLEITEAISNVSTSFKNINKENNSKVFAQAYNNSAAFLDELKHR